MKILSLSLRKKNKINFALFFTMMTLLAIGFIFVYSASSYSAKISYLDEFFFLKKQLFGFAVGFILFLFFTFFDYHKLEKIKWIFLILSYILLLLVFIPGIGLTNYGATRWINLRFITFQPSEIAKFAFIVFSASVLSKRSERVKSFKGIIPILIVGVMYCFLIIMEPNMSITICMACLMVAMLFIGGANLKHFLLRIYQTI